MSDLFEAAERTLSNYSWHSYIYDYNRKDREKTAASLYLKAAHKFQKQLQYKKAAESYRNASKYSDDKMSLVNAFHCYLKVDLPLAGTMLKEISKQHSDHNKIAKQQQQLAERYKMEENYVSAIIWFQEAANNYLEKDRQLNCLVQIAAIYCEKLKIYKKAAAYYQRVADIALDDDSLPEFLLKAGLSWMHELEPNTLRQKIQKYAEISTFVTTPEYALLMKLVTVLEKGNQALANKILQMNHLETWTL